MVCKLYINYSFMYNFEFDGEQNMNEKTDTYSKN